MNPRPTGRGLNDGKHVFGRKAQKASCDQEGCLSSHIPRSPGLLSPGLAMASGLHRASIFLLHHPCTIGSSFRPSSPRAAEGFAAARRGPALRCFLRRKEHLLRSLLSDISEHLLGQNYVTCPFPNESHGPGCEITLNTEDSRGPAPR